MLKVGIIGIGNAGNQVAELAKRERNIEGIAINSSEKDISTITAVSKMIVGDEKGAGKDRNIAKMFISENIHDILKESKMSDVITNNEVIFVVSSTGGGTGSGMAPVLTEILTKVYPNKKFILVDILPPLKESIGAQQNTIDYLKERRSFRPTYMSYDNQTRTHCPTKEMMEEVNRKIVDDICIIRGDYLYPTPYNSIDEKDMSKIIDTSDRLIVVEIEGIKEKDLDDKSIEDRLIDELVNKSVITEIERDRIVKRLGVISHLNDNLSKHLNTDLPIIKQLIGEPVEGFEHVFVNADDESNRVILIMSGLSDPDDRIQKILQRIEEAREALLKTKEKSILDSTDTNFIDGLRSSDEVVSLDSIDLGDIMTKYIKK